MDEPLNRHTNVKATVNDENVAVIDNGDGTCHPSRTSPDLTVTGKRTGESTITVDA